MRLEAPGSVEGHIVAGSPGEMCPRVGNVQAIEHPTVTPFPVCLVVLRSGGKRWTYGS